MSSEPSTAAFRKEHLEIRKHLEHLSEMAGKLPGMSAIAQRDAMKQIIDFLKGHIKPHAEWEERLLYPAVDRRAGLPAVPFTATIRNEHRIVGRSITELEAAMAQKTPDPKDFLRKTVRLLGLLSAHFESEEDVLLPVLDQSMTAEEFQREILKKAEH